MTATLSGTRRSAASKKKPRLRERLRVVSGAISGSIGILGFSSFVPPKRLRATKSGLFCQNAASCPHIGRRRDCRRSDSLAADLGLRRVADASPSLVLSHAIEKFQE